MQKALQKIFNCWGCEMIRKNDVGEEAFRGFFQHTGSKDQRQMFPEYSPLGKISGGQYTLIAPPEVQLAAGDTIQRKGKEYILCRVEEVMYQNERLYIWGLCTGKGGADNWAAQS